MAQIDSYGSKPGGLEGSEIFIFASTTETYNCTLNEISDYIKSHWGAASGTNNGYLSSTDWTTFNNKLSSFTESDPIFAAWLSITPPAYPEDIPTALSELSDDTTHRLVTDTEKNTWSSKQDALVSGTNIKTVNNTTLLGSGNLLIGAAGPTSTPIFTDNGSGNGTISSITCNVYATVDGIGELKNYTIASDSFTFTDGIESYVVVDYNSGTPIYRVETNKLLINSFSIITVMIVWRVGNTLHERDASAFAIGLPEKLNKSIINTIPYQRSIDGGLILSETSTPNPRTLLVSQSYVYAGVTAENVLTYNSSIDSLVEVTVTTGTYTFTSGKLVYDNLYYNPPSGPVLLGNNKWGNIFIYRSVGDIKEVFYLFGVTQYNSSELALQEAKPAPTALPPVLKSHCMYIGRIVRQKSSSSGIIRSAFDVESEYSSFDLANTIHNATAVTSIDDVSEFGLWDNLTSLLRKITWANIKTTIGQGITFISSGLKILGSSTGYTAIASANASANNYTATLPAKDITVAGLDDVATRKFYHGLESCGAPSFDNSTHILTIATSTTYWYKGTRVYLSTAITCDIDSFETLTANTLYYFYFDDATGTLKCSDSQWNLKEHIPTFQVFWNGSEGAILIEKHNHTRDIDWHINAHTTIGTRYGSGLSKTYPDTANDALLQIESGSIWDEDQNLTIAQQTTCRGVYKASASVYTFANYSLPYVGTSGQPQYLDTDTYALTNVGASDFVVMWYYATNDYNRPIWIIPTHAATAYNTIGAARAETIPALSGLNLAPEMKLIYKVIYKGDGQFQEFVDYRNSSSLPAGGVPSSTAASTSFAPNTYTTSTNVQAAIEEVQEDAIIEYISMACSDVSTALTTGTNKANFAFNFNFTLLAVFGKLDTVCTGSSFIFDINNGANSFLSTKLSIDASENTSLTAETPAVIDATYQDYTAGTKITVDFDQVGATIAGAGAGIILKVRRTS